MTDGLSVDLDAVGESEGGGPLLFDPLSKIGDLAAEAGLQRVELVAWRDLDHPEAGGSELHAARIAERWAAAGIDVCITASRSPGADPEVLRDGYRVRRPAGRYGIFPVAGLGRLTRRVPRPDGTVEIWNGMPFFSPIWARGPRVVFLHHVHDRMWDLVLPSALAAVGRVVERRVAPPLYRRTPVVTLSESSRQAIVEVLRLQPHRVTVVQPGVDESFCPGGRRDPSPLVVAVGRLVTYKRFDLLIDVLVRLRERHPTLTAVIAGEGSERPALERLIADRGAAHWLALPGRISDDALVDLYRRAWALVSTSAHEGWGLTITEAAACATPAVVSPIAGHRDAVDHGVTGFLAEPGTEMEQQLDLLLRDALVRRRMQRAARLQSSQLTWDRTALETLRVLAAQSGTFLGS
jgi:glycosyltransferase involved in cell wall biosynthesis